VPLYAFACEVCGPFELRRPVLDAAAAGDCPACGASARRIFTPPGVARTAAPLRAARDREERSVHQPDVVRAPAGRPLPWQHGHAHGPSWTLGH
jgi:putative FmdB family regulatory protein